MPRGAGQRTSSGERELERTLAPAQDSPRRLSGRSFVVRIAFALAVVVGVYFGVLPRLADVSAAGHHAGSMGGFDLATLGVLAIVSMLTSAFVLTAVMPGLSLGQAFVVGQSATAVANTMPAGGAVSVGVSYRMYGSWGHSRSAITLNVLLTGVGNIACKLALPIVALVLLAATGGASAGVIGAALVGLLMLAIVVSFAAAGLASERVAWTIGRAVGLVSGKVRRWFRRPPQADAGIAATRFRREAVELLRRRGGRMAVGMVAHHATQFVLLLVALRAVGVTAGQVSWTEALAGYSAASLLTALPVTPGGVGVMELGLAGALIAAGGPHAEVLAAVLVFRAISLLLPLPLGAISYVVWRCHSGWRRAPRSLSPALA